MRRIGLAVVLALSVALAPLFAEAQQATQIARIGYLGRNPANPQLNAAFLQGLRNSVTSRVATSSLNTGIPRGNSSGSPLLRPNSLR